MSLIKKIKFAGTGFILGTAMLLNANSVLADGFSSVYGNLGHRENIAGVDTSIDSKILSMGVGGFDTSGRSNEDLISKIVQSGGLHIVVGTDRSSLTDKSTTEYGLEISIGGENPRSGISPFYSASLGFNVIGLGAKIGLDKLSQHKNISELNKVVNAGLGLAYVGKDVLIAGGFLLRHMSDFGNPSFSNGINQYGWFLRFIYR